MVLFSCVDIFTFRFRVRFYTTSIVSRTVYVVQSVARVQPIAGAVHCTSGGAVHCTQWCKIWYQVVQPAAHID